MNDADITDINDLVQKMIPQTDDLFSPDLSLTNSPSTSETFNDSEDENCEILQLNTFREIYPFLVKQALNISLFDPSF